MVSCTHIYRYSCSLYKLYRNIQHCDVHWRKISKTKVRVWMVALALLLPQPQVSVAVVFNYYKMQCPKVWQTTQTHTCTSALPLIIQHCNRYRGSSSSGVPRPAPSSGWTSLLVTNCMWKKLCRAHWTLVLLLFLRHVPAEMKWDPFLFSLLPLFTALCPLVCWINGQRCLTVKDILFSFFFLALLFLTCLEI